MQALRRAARHPRSESFVEPQVVPPAHRDQVAEPLMRDLVRGDVEDALLVRLRGDRRIEQHRVLEREDRAPVLHRAEEAAAARRGDVVELRQRVRSAEVIVVLAQHAHRRVERELRLIRLALLRDDAELGRAVLRGGAIEFAEPEEQQVGRHLRRSSGSARERARLRASTRSATGMLLTAICSCGTIASSVNVALYAGSSHEGIMRRASGASNCVYSARLRPAAVS